MIIAIRVLDSNIQNIKVLNRIIPLFVLSMYLPTLAITNMEAYDSEVVWAFCLSLVFTLMQLCSLLFVLPGYE